MAGMVSLPMNMLMGGGNIKWLAEPIVVATEYLEVSITPSYGIFFVVGGDSFIINKITNYQFLSQKGLLKNDRLYRKSFVIASPKNNLMSYGYEDFLFVPNSFGAKLSSVTQASGTGSGEYFTIYKLADIQ